MNFFSLNHLKLSNNSSYLKYIQLLAGDLELNPRPNQVNTLWDPFNNKGLHFVHLNINSLLPKIDELRTIARDTKAAIIALTESKLDATIFDSEISISGYNVLRKDRNRHGGGVTCYIRSDISFNILNSFKTQNKKNKNLKKN